MISPCHYGFISFDTEFCGKCHGVLFDRNGSSFDMKALKQLLGQAFNFTPVTLSCFCTMLWTLLHEMVELMEGVPVYMSLFLL